MIEFLTSIWPVVLGIGSAIGGLFGFYHLLLSIRESKQNLNSKKSASAAEESLIKLATAEETMKYGRPLPSRSSMLPAYLLAVILCLVIGGGLYLVFR